MSAKLTLQAFIEETKKELDRFEQHWIEQNKLDPDSWIMEMGSGDWFDQFLLSEGSVASAPNSKL